MTLSLSGVTFSLATPELNCRIDRLTALLLSMEGRLTQAEQKLTDKVTEFVATTEALEARITEVTGGWVTASAALQASLDQQTRTSEALAAQIAVLQQQLTDGQIGGAGAATVANVIDAVQAEIDDVKAFQAGLVAPAPPVDPAPPVADPPAVPAPDVDALPPAAGGPPAE